MLKIDYVLVFKCRIVKEYEFQVAKRLNLPKWTASSSIINKTEKVLVHLRDYHITALEEFIQAQFWSMNKSTCQLCFKLDYPPFKFLYGKPIIKNKIPTPILNYYKFTLTFNSFRKITKKRNIEILLYNEMTRAKAGMCKFTLEGLEYQVVTGFISLYTVAYLQKEKYIEENIAILLCKDLDCEEKYKECLNDIMDIHL